MTTLAGLRARLRVVLGDDAAAGYLWRDGALNRHLDDAVRAYSRFFPRELADTVATVAGQAEYDLPEGASAIVRVEVVEGGACGNTLLLEGGDSHGDGYRLWGGKLVLIPASVAAGKTLKLSYLAPHTTMVAEGDVSTAPTADEDLLVAFAAARALEELASEEAKRQRFEERAGRPAVSAGRSFREEFAAGVAARRSRLRVGRLVIR